MTEELIEKKNNIEELYEYYDKNMNFIFSITFDVVELIGKSDAIKLYTQGLILKLFYN